MNLLEIVLLAVAIGAIVIVGLDLLGAPLRRRRERSYLAELSADGDEAGNKRAQSGSWRSRVERLLRASGFGFGALVFVVLAAGFSLIVFLAVMSFSGRLLLAAALLALLAFYLPFVLLREWGRWRGWRFEERLMDPVDFMVSALGAGENPTQALATAAEVAREPVRTELEGVVSRLNAGLDIADALEPMQRRYDIEGVQLFAQTLIVKWRAGGDLSGVMRTIAEVLRERVAVNMRLKSELAGVQISAVVIALIPYLMIPFMLALRPTWAPTLMENPMGPALLAIAVSLQLIGFLWLRRILRVEL